MKTAISIPDSLFEEADRLAKTRGWSRSELYVDAVSAYVKSERFSGVRDVTVTRRASGLPQESVVNVSQLITLDKRRLTDREGRSSALRYRPNLPCHSCSYAHSAV